MWFLPSRDLPIFVVPVVRLWSKLAFIENLGTSGTSKPDGEVKTPSHRGVTIYSGFSVHRALHCFEKHLFSPPVSSDPVSAHRGCDLPRAGRTLVGMAVFPTPDLFLETDFIGAAAFHSFRPCCPPGTASAGAAELGAALSTTFSSASWASCCGEFISGMYLRRCSR
jgi:hypothetical protein